MKQFLMLCLSLVVVLFSSHARAITKVVNGITWEYSIANNTAKITGISKDSIGAVTVPSQLDGYSVTAIGQGAFQDCVSITSVIIPKGVTTIWHSAFEGCSSLISVDIPDSVQSIEMRAFMGCSFLTSIVIPEGVTTIRSATFYGCLSLSSVVVPDSVTSIESQAFRNCSSLTSINIPDNVTTIGLDAFSLCTSLTSIIIPEGVTTIPAWAFWGCSSLTSVVIPDSVTSIESRAFWNCSSLTSIIIPEKVTSIGIDAFNGCISLTSIVIPESILSIGENAFSSTDNLTTVVFRGSVPEQVIKSGLLDKQIVYQQEHAAEWEQVLSNSNRLTLSDLLVPYQVAIRVWTEMVTPKTIKVTYTVRSELPSVKVRAVAFKDGVRSFANIVPVRTGEGVPKGESVTTNEEHSFVWEVASDWATDLDKVAVEILVQEGTLLPQERITIPATKSHKAMTITRNALTERWLFDALVWCYAEGDPQLVVNDGRVSVNGTDIAKDDKLPTGTYWDGNYHSGWKREATALLNYLYGKMGYKVLAGEDLEYAEVATRLDFADEASNTPLRQVSVKIEEGE